LTSFLLSAEFTFSDSWTTLEDLFSHSLIVEKFFSSEFTKEQASH